MEKLFIPYEESLALKELGFNEFCLATYDSSKKLIFESGRVVKNSSYFWVKAAPLYQQAFKWLVKQISNPLYVEDFMIAHLSEYDNKEEAELECLRKLIEIVKNK